MADMTSLEFDRMMTWALGPSWEGKLLSTWKEDFAELHPDYPPFRGLDTPPVTQIRNRWAMSDDYNQYCNECENITPDLYTRMKNKIKDLPNQLKKLRGKK